MQRETPMTSNNQDRTASGNAIDREMQGWKFQIGDLVRAVGELDGEMWEEFLIVIGRIWSDEKSATYFEGCEERIEPGCNYFCKLIDDRGYTEFYPEATISLVARGNQNNAA
jgi:hypothetical protein